MATSTFEKVVLSQGAADTVIIEGKSSDVAHGMTALAETDSWVTLQKLVGDDGGALLRGLSDGTSTAAMVVQGITSAAADTTKSTAGLGVCRISGAIKNGTGAQAIGANGNILSVDNNGTTRFILDGDGDSHQDVGTAWTNFDVCNDIEMLNVLSAFASRPTDPLRANFQQWLAVPENRDRLEALGLATFNDGPDGDGSVFVNMSRLAMLLVGAVRQMSERFTALESRVAMLLPAGA